MQRRWGLLAAVAAAGGMLVSSMVSAHDSGNDGHIPSNVNYGFELIGRDALGGVEDGLYTDVWSHEGYAYVGTFQNPDCSNAGVFVVDIDQAIAQYQSDGTTSGATVAEIKSAPNTRVNDVKVHTVGDTDVLIATEEPCGGSAPGGAVSDFNINKSCPLNNPDCQRNNDNKKAVGAPLQKGNGGISLYDVSDPTRPRPLIKNFYETGGVHNTFAWDWEGRSYLIGTANTFDFFDTFIVDITDPRQPELLTVTGALDWFGAGAFTDGQFEEGSSAGIFNHDVWVEIIDGVPTAVVSYWDVGFVTLDLTNPANPVYLMDTTYPGVNVSGQPYEGNAHAAVFGGIGDYIFGGDEDFSPSSLGVEYDGVEYPAGDALFGSSDPVVGTLVVAGSEGCAAGDVPAATADGQVVLIDRGSCFFSDKGYSAEQAGYVGYIIANNAGDDLLNMSAGDNALPAIPGIFVGQSTGDAMKATPGLIATEASVYDGWGYLHIINNTGGDLDVPTMGRDSADMTVPTGHHLGYYAPAETVGAPELGTDFGDLTMHNIEVDPTNQDTEPSYFDGPRMFVSWYSLGMRALEYRPGHYHTNANGEGFYSQNVHEVGRWIEPDGGSNFWGVHVDTASIDDEDTQIILASDRNNGLYIFTFSCQTTLDTGDTVFYCVIPGTEPSGEGGGG